MSKNIGKTLIQHAPYSDDPVNKPRCKLDCTLNRAGAPAIGDDYLRLESFQGQDAVSQPFEYQLHFKANDTINRQDLCLDFSKIIGQLAVVRLGVASPTLPAYQPSEWSENQWEFTYFTGMVTSFSMAEPGSYRAMLKPFLWKLNLTNHYQVYGRGAKKNGISICEAIKQVLDRHEIRHRMEFAGSHNPAKVREQNWLQAGESDFQFISNLMNKAYIYYYFEHDETGHTMVLSNSITSYQELIRDGHPLQLRYTFTRDDSQSLEQDDLVTSYNYEQSLNTSGVKSTVVRTEAAWEENKVAQFNIYNGMKNENSPLLFHQYEIWQYGGSSDHAQTHAQLASSCEIAASSKLSGSSTCELLKPGFKFSLANGDAQVRPELEGESFVVTQVQHQCSDSGSYQNSFEATEPEGLITPFQLHNTHQGMIIGRVSTPPAEPSDWRYYPKNSFDWDQHTCLDTASQDSPLNAKGVWVVLSTDGPQGTPVWIKLAQHMQTVPEPGATVLVSRSNDESELPEIQSIIQANGSQVIMPDYWTANTNVGNSYSTSYGDGKRISYGKSSSPNLPDAEQIVENEYNTGQYKDASFSQGASYSYSTSETGKDGLLSRSESFGSTYSKHHGAESDSYSEIDLSTSTSVIGQSESDTTITKDSISSTHIKGKSDSTTKIDSGSYNNTTITGDNNSDTTINGKTYSKSTHNGDVESHTNITGSSISRSSISSSDSTSAIGASTNSSAIGASNSNSAVGISNNNSTTGVGVNITATGVSTNSSATGVSNNNSATGASVNLSYTGVSASVDMVDTSAKVSKVTTSLSADIVLGGVCFEKNMIEAKQPLMTTSIIGAIKAIL